MFFVCLPEGISNDGIFLLAETPPLLRCFLVSKNPCVAADLAQDQQAEDRQGCSPKAMEPPKRTGPLVHGWENSLPNLAGFDHFDP